MAQAKANSTPLRVLDATGFDRRTRFMPIQGDGMMPTLRRGDFVAVIPCDEFRGDGVYVVVPWEGRDPSIYRISRSGKVGKLRVAFDNRLYGSGEHLSLEQVNKMIVGAVVANVQFM